MFINTHLLYPLYDIIDIKEKPKTAIRLQS